jgi:hypothetical protein
MKWPLRETSLATSLAALVLVIQPSWFGLVIRVWLVVIGLLLSGAILSGAFARFPAEAAGPRHDGSVDLIRPVGEVRHIRDIEEAKDFVIAVDYQLFPFLRDQLREIAAYRLLTNHNIHLERDSRLARQLLGDEIWELVRPAASSDKTEGWGTISTAQLSTITRDLEKL